MTEKKKMNRCKNQHIRRSAQNQNVYNIYFGLKDIYVFECRFYKQQKLIIYFYFRNS